MIASDTLLHGARVRYEKQGEGATEMDQLVEQLLKDDYTCSTTLVCNLYPVMQTVYAAVSPCLCSHITLFLLIVAVHAIQ